MIYRFILLINTMSIKVYAQTKYFVQIAHVLGRLYGFKVTTEPTFSNTDTYIIFIPWLLETLPSKYIIYNFEQLKYCTDKLNVLHYENAEQIWDFSQVNIEFLKRNNVSTNKIKFFPYGYFPEMIFKSNFCPYFSRDISCAFIGFMNRRRKEVLEPIYKYCTKNNMKFYCSNNCWGNEYENICSRTKIAFNIHFYGSDGLMEVHRIAPLVANGIAVISEKSCDEWYNERLEGIVYWVHSTNDLCNVFSKLIGTDSVEMNFELQKRKKLLIERLNFSTNKISINNNECTI